MKPTADKQAAPNEPADQPPSGGIDMAQVYLEVRASLMRYASRYFRRTQEAEDVVQEAFVKVIQAQRERDIRSPKSYLFRTARNLSLAQVNKKAYKLTDELGDLLTETELQATQSMEEQFEARENFEVFCRAVRQLPVKSRRAFVLCRVYGFSQKEAAAKMGIGVSAIESHLSRATRRCVDYIEAEEAGRHHQTSAGARIAHNREY